LPEAPRLLFCPLKHTLTEEQTMKTSTSCKPQHTDTPRANVYTRVTDTILTQLEQGVRPWMKP
jgi:hypothetical protein